jgi:REP element-mobilizing transposase RayT
MAGSFTSLNYHIVFSTKERRPILRSVLRELLFPYVQGTLQNLKGHLIQGGGFDDHVHLLIRLHQDVAIADCVRTIKSNASKWLRQDHDRDWLGWQDGYGAFTVSKSHIPDVQAYIQNQEEHHVRASFQDELRALLIRHEIEFDERYIWL